MTTKQKAALLKKLRAMIDRVLVEAVEGGHSKQVTEAVQLMTGEKPFLPVTGFHMRNDVKGRVEVLARVFDKWIVVFGKDGPGPTAVDDDQIIDHMIHSGGIANLINKPKRKTRSKR